MNTYTEDQLVEQPAIQLMQHELGWDVENGILNDEFWILNGRGRRREGARLNFKLNQAESSREIERSGFPLAAGSLVFKQSL